MNNLLRRLRYQYARLDNRNKGWVLVLLALAAAYLATRNKDNL